MIGSWIDAFTNDFAMNMLADARLSGPKTSTDS